MNENAFVVKMQYEGNHLIRWYGHPNELNKELLKLLKVGHSKSFQGYRWSII